MQNDFKAMLGFVERVVAKLNVEENNDRVSVVLYNSEPFVEFYLNTYKMQQSVSEKLGIVKHIGGRPRNTGAALQYIKDNVLTASFGSRHQQGVPQILVLLTGGRSSDDVRSAVENLKRNGVMVLVVGTKNADALEMQSMSQEAIYAFFAPDSSDLLNIDKQILSAIKKIGSPAIKPALYGKTVMTSCCTLHAQLHILTNKSEVIECKLWTLQLVSFYGCWIHWPLEHRYYKFLTNYR